MTPRYRAFFSAILILLITPGLAACVNSLNSQNRKMDNRAYIVDIHPNTAGSEHLARVSYRPTMQFQTADWRQEQARQIQLAEEEAQKFCQGPIKVTKTQHLATPYWLGESFKNTTTPYISTNVRTTPYTEVMFECGG